MNTKNSINESLEIIRRALEDEKNDTNYLNYKYSSKVFKPSLIQSGLQTPNTLSSVIYLGDFYKVTPVIYIDSIKSKLKTDL